MRKRSIQFIVANTKSTKHIDFHPFLSYRTCMLVLEFSPVKSCVSKSQVTKGQFLSVKIQADIPARVQVLTYFNSFKHYTSYPSIVCALLQVAHMPHTFPEECTNFTLSSFAKYNFLCSFIKANRTYSQATAWETKCCLDLRFLG